MHIIDPSAYPLSSTAAYNPEPAKLEQALSFERQNLHMSNIVIIQPSIYGTNNTCTLDALREIREGGRQDSETDQDRDARAVVVIDPSSIDPDTLHSWDALGARGIRINCITVGRHMDSEELEEVLHAHAQILLNAGLDHWIVQLYIALDAVASVAHVIPTLGVRVCLDHFASPMIVEGAEAKGSSTTAENASLINPQSIPGFSDLASLLATGTTYIKLSAAYRISYDKSLTWCSVVIGHMSSLLDTMYGHLQKLVCDGVRRSVGRNW